MVFNILHGGKSCKSVLKNVNPEWVITADVYINTHVKLAVVDEVRTTQILLYNDRSFPGDLCPFVDDLDSNPSGRSRLKLTENPLISLIQWKLMIMTKGKPQSQFSQIDFFVINLQARVVSLSDNRNVHTIATQNLIHNIIPKSVKLTTFLIQQQNDSVHYNLK